MNLPHRLTAALRRALPSCTVRLMLTVDRKDINSRQLAMKLAVRRTLYLLSGLLLTLLLPSCDSQDRVLTIACDSSEQHPLGVRAIHDAEALAFTPGSLNTHNLLPGTILQLAEHLGTEETQSSIAVYSLPTSDRDYVGPADAAWYMQLTNLRFHMTMDKDVAESFGLGSDIPKLTQKIGQSTELVAVAAQKKELRYPLQLINADPGAVQIIRNVSHRYAVVSGVIYGSGIGLTYIAPGPGVHIVASSGFYLHIKYSCGPVDAINAQRDTLGPDFPVLYLYTPIRYVPERGTVEQAILR